MVKKQNNDKEEKEFNVKNNKKNEKNNKSFNNQKDNEFSVKGLCNKNFIKLFKRITI